MITPDKTSQLGKKEQVREMFDSIAPRYDFLNHCLSMHIDKRWRRKTVRMVARQQPASLLDVATGTGDLAIALRKKLPESSQITGVDLSPQMLRIGREKIARIFPGKEFAMVEGDAENLPFEAESFDAVTAAFGVRNFEDIPAGLQQMYRVLKPEGQVYILEFSMPGNNILGRLYRFYFRHILPKIGRLVSGSRGAYQYLPESVGGFPYGERFEGLLREAGFSAVSHRKLMGGIAMIYNGKKR